MSINAIKTEVAQHIRRTGHRSLREVPLALQLKWEAACDYECFHSDCNSYMEECYSHFLDKSLFIGDAEPHNQGDFGI